MDDRKMIEICHWFLNKMEHFMKDFAFFLGSPIGGMPSYVAGDKN